MLVKSQPSRSLVTRILQDSKEASIQGIQGTGQSSMRKYGVNIFLHAQQKVLVLLSDRMQRGIIKPTAVALASMLNALLLLRWSEPAEKSTCRCRFASITKTTVSRNKSFVKPVACKSALYAWIEQSTSIVVRAEGQVPPQFRPLTPAYPSRSTIHRPKSDTAVNTV
jgi:polynucleotide 5'-kinase involved in rRNA processing